jgi:hypothetical protein
LSLRWKLIPKYTANLAAFFCALLKLDNISMMLNLAVIVIFVPVFALENNLTVVT